MACVQELVNVCDDSHHKGAIEQQLQSCWRSQIEELRRALQEQQAANHALKASEMQLRQYIEELEAKCADQQRKLDVLLQQTLPVDRDIHQQCDQLGPVCLQPDDSAQTMMCTNVDAAHRASDFVTPTNCTTDSSASHTHPLTTLAAEDLTVSACSPKSLSHGQCNTRTPLSARSLSSQPKHPFFGLLHNISTAFKKAKRNQAARASTTSSAQTAGTRGKKAPVQTPAEELQLVTPSLLSEPLSIKAGKSPSSFSSDGASGLFEPPSPRIHDQGSPTSQVTPLVTHVQTRDCARNSTDGTPGSRQLHESVLKPLSNPATQVASDAQHPPSSCVRLDVTSALARDSNVSCRRSPAPVIPGACEEDHDFLTLPLGPLFATTQSTDTGSCQAGPGRQLPHASSAQELDVCETNGVVHQKVCSELLTGTSGAAQRVAGIRLDEADVTEVREAVCVLDKTDAVPTAAGPVKSFQEVGDRGVEKAPAAADVRCTCFEESMEVYGSRSSGLTAGMDAGDGGDEGMWDGWSRLRAQRDVCGSVQPFQIEEVTGAQFIDQQRWALPWSQTSSSSEFQPVTAPAAGASQARNTQTKQPGASSHTRAGFSFNLFRTFTIPPMSRQASTKLPRQAGKDQPIRADASITSHSSPHSPGVPAPKLITDTSLLCPSTGEDVDTLDVQTTAGMHAVQHCTAIDTSRSIDEGSLLSHTGGGGDDDSALFQDCATAGMSDTADNDEDDSFYGRPCYNESVQLRRVWSYSSIDGVAVALAQIGPAGTSHAESALTRQVVELPLMDFSKFKGAEQQPELVPAAEGLDSTHGDGTSGTSSLSHEEQDASALHTDAGCVVDLKEDDSIQEMDRGEEGIAESAQPEQQAGLMAEPNMIDEGGLIREDNCEVGSGENSGTGSSQWETNAKTVPPSKLPRHRVPSKKKKKSGSSRRSKTADVVSPIMQELSVLSDRKVDGAGQG